MRTERTGKMMKRKTVNQLSKMERICLYLHDHPEYLTDELMEEVATRFLNYAYIRKTIKNLYPKIVADNIRKDNFIIIPEHYENK